MRRSEDDEAGTEPALLQAQHEQKLQTLGILAAAVAHDFNNLLTAILGHASLLAESLPLHHPERSSIDEIIAGSQQAAGLARQLLSYTRTTPAALRPLDLNEVARDTYSLLRRIIGVDVQLRVDLAPDVPPVAADPAQIAQLLMNLIMNARDALPGERGHVWVRTRVQADRTVALEVEDDGVGMGAEVQARLFEPFFSTKGSARGTGLGMAIVEGIVRRHHGSIAVESSPGAGTRIRVLLPAAD